MKPRSFKVRLAIYHTAAVACFLALASLGGHWTLSRLVLGNLDAALVTLAETEAGALQADAQGPPRVHELAPGMAPPSFVRLDRFVQIVDRDGGILARSANLGTAVLPTPVPMLDRLRSGQVVFETFRSFGEEPIRMAALPVNVRGRMYTIQVAGSLDDAYALLDRGRWLFAGLSLALLAAVALTSVSFARRALRPLDRIVTQARGIGESGLAGRLPHPGGRDEMGRLVDTLNAMLARIERSVESQKRFTADASHELRSPLSRLRAELEVTLRRPRDQGEYVEALRSGLEEVERLSEITEQLLKLARLDAEQQAGGPAPTTAVSSLVEESVRKLRAQAARRDVALVLEPPPPSLAVRANPAAVAMALTNVLDNAVKFSPAGGTVRVAFRAEGPEVVILVSDSGPGLSAEEMPRLFERFHRGSVARSSGAPGFGLGLAISQAAIERERGRIRAESGPQGGASFSIHLPLAD